MLSEELEGIVIRTHPARESDLVIRIISKNQGKVSLYARGAKRSKKRFGSSFDIFDCGIFYCQESKSNLSSITSFKSITSFPELRSDFNRMIAASAFCEVYEKLVPERIPDAEELFNNLRFYLDDISKSNDEKTILRSLFHGIFNCLSLSGVLDSAIEVQASLKNMNHLLDLVEHHSESKLNSRDSLNLLLRSLKPLVTATS